MKQMNIKILIRFLKEENLYKIVIDALKYYIHNIRYETCNIMELIKKMTCDGLFVKRLLEFVDGILFFHKPKKNCYENIVDNVDFYVRKWEIFLINFCYL